VNSPAATRRVFWAAVWLAAVLVGIKAYYLGASPRDWSGPSEFLRALAAISYRDALFAAMAWTAGRGALVACGSRRLWRSLTSVSFVAIAALAGIYAVVSVLVFGVFGGFPTYSLLALVGDVRMLSSSVAARMTPPVVATLIVLPLAYTLLVEAFTRSVRPDAPRRRIGGAIVFGSLAVWLAVGMSAFSADWSTRHDRRVADNPHWVLASSWWDVLTSDGTVRLTDRFPADLLKDFDPIRGNRTMRAGRPPNVIVIVLESVAARWTSLNGGPYDSTPVLARESARALVVQNFYAHVGRSSNSLAAMFVSAYPKLGFRDITEEYPDLPGTSLASLFRDRGYRTAFVTPSDLGWANWSAFLAQRGFGELKDIHQIACSAPISSWGVEDRCMVDSMIEFIGESRQHPFFLVGWTTQTHHPYEPTPGLPVVEMQREPVPDQWELDRYLNVLHDTDRHLGRLFDTLRRLRLDQDTLVVVVGDHGQAFGYPHDTYVQGRTMYEEDVHVPLMLWYPRLYKKGARSQVVGSHVDLAPTIADLTGLQPAPEWQGRSLFEPDRAQRAYFYVAEEQFTLGLREGPWKYIVNLREGFDELYNLDRDPDEQQNLAAAERERAALMRQRLAAWTEANRRQYDAASQPLRTAAFR
jgi:arylsulfatase A-like enzyme